MYGISTYIYRKNQTFMKSPRSYGIYLETLSIVLHVYLRRGPKYFLISRLPNLNQISFASIKTHWATNIQEVLHEIKISCVAWIISNDASIRRLVS